MFQQFFKNIIAEYASDYFEDFNANQLVIDKWRGKVTKQNVRIKSTALRKLISHTFGLPIEVQKGFLKKIIINVPWSSLNKDPVTIELKDLIVICRSSNKMDADIVKRMKRRMKLNKVSEILEKIVKKSKVQQYEDKNKQNSLSHLGWYSKLKSTIVQNLTVKATNLHFRFQDNCVSSPQKFSFTTVIDSIYYSATDSCYRKTFVSLEKKLEEKKFFALIQIKKIAVFWNPYILHTNEEIMNMTCDELVAWTHKLMQDMFERYVDQQNQSSVFCVAPFDLTIKLRKDLSQNLSTRYPMFTISLELSPLDIRIDNEMWKSLLCLSDLISWHNTQSYEPEIRPLFRVQKVEDDPKLYWKYAIASIISLIRQRKKNESEHNAQNIQFMKDQYSALKFIKLMNNHRVLTGRVEIMEVTYKDNKYDFKSNEQMNKLEFDLEMELDIQEMLAARTMAQDEYEKQIAQQIEESIRRKNIKSGGWRSYLKLPWRNKKRQNHPNLNEDDQISDLESFSNSTIEPNSITHFTSIIIQQENSGSPKENFLKNQLAFRVQRISLSLFSVRQLMQKNNNQQKYCLLNINLRQIFFQKLTFINQSRILLSLTEMEIQAPNEKQNFKTIFKRQIPKYPQFPDGLTQIEEQQQKMYQVESQEGPLENNGLPMIQKYSQINRGNKVLFLLQMRSKFGLSRLFQDCGKTAGQALFLKNQGNQQNLGDIGEAQDIFESTQQQNACEKMIDQNNYARKMKERRKMHDTNLIQFTIQQFHLHIPSQVVFDVMGTIMAARSTIRYRKDMNTPNIGSNMKQSQSLVVQNNIPICQMAGKIKGLSVSISERIAFQEEKAQENIFLISMKEIDIRDCHINQLVDLNERKVFALNQLRAEQILQIQNILFKCSAVTVDYINQKDEQINYLEQNAKNHLLNEFSLELRNIKTICQTNQEVDDEVLLLENQISFSPLTIDLSEHKLKSALKFVEQIQQKLNSFKNARKRAFGISKYDENIFDQQENLMLSSRNQEIFELLAKHAKEHNVQDLMKSELQRRKSCQIQLTEQILEKAKESQSEDQDQFYDAYNKDEIKQIVRQTYGIKKAKSSQEVIDGAINNFGNKIKIISSYHLILQRLLIEFSCQSLNLSKIAMKFQNFFAKCQSCSWTKNRSSLAQLDSYLFLLDEIQIISLKGGIDLPLGLIFEVNQLQRPNQDDQNLYESKSSEKKITLKGNEIYFHIDFDNAGIIDDAIQGITVIKQKFKRGQNHSSPQRRDKRKSQQSSTSLNCILSNFTVFISSKDNEIIQINLNQCQYLSDTNNGSLSFNSFGINTVHKGSRNQFLKICSFDQKDSAMKIIKEQNNSTVMISKLQLNESDLGAKTLFLINQSILFIKLMKYIKSNNQNAEIQPVNQITPSSNSIKIILKSFQFLSEINQDSHGVIKMQEFCTQLDILNEEDIKQSQMKLHFDQFNFQIFLTNKNFSLDIVNMRNFNLRVKSYKNQSQFGDRLITNQKYKLDSISINISPKSLNLLLLLTDKQIILFNQINEITHKLSKPKMQELLPPQPLPKFENQEQEYWQNFILQNVQQNHHDSIKQFCQLYKYIKFANNKQAQIQKFSINLMEFEKINSDNAKAYKNSHPILSFSLQNQSINLVKLEGHFIPQPDSIQYTFKQDLIQLEIEIPYLNLYSFPQLNSQIVSVLKIDKPSPLSISLVVNELAIFKIPEIEVALNNVTLNSIHKAFSKINRIASKIKNYSFNKKKSSSLQRMKDIQIKSKTSLFPKLELTLDSFVLEICRELQQSQKIIVQFGFQVSSLSHQVGESPVKNAPKFDPIMERSISKEEIEQNEEDKEEGEEQYQEVLPQRIKPMQRSGMSDHSQDLVRSSQIQIKDLSISIESQKQTLTSEVLKIKDRVNVLYETTLKACIDQKSGNEFRIDILISLIEVDTVSSSLITIHNNFQFLANSIKEFPMLNSEGNKQLHIVEQQNKRGTYSVCTSFETDKIMLNILSEHYKSRTIPMWSFQIAQFGGSFEVTKIDNTQLIIHTFVSSFSLFYFNIPYHFFEPLIEPVSFEITSGSARNQKFNALEILIKDSVNGNPLNINLPIALYECMAAFLNQIFTALKQKREEQRKNQFEQQHDDNNDEQEKIQQTQQQQKQNDSDNQLIDQKQIKGLNFLAQQLSSSPKVRNESSSPYQFTRIQQGPHIKKSHSFQKSAYAIKNLTGQIISYGRNRLLLRQNELHQQQIIGQNKLESSPFQSYDRQNYVMNNNLRQIQFFNDKAGLKSPKSQEEFVQQFRKSSYNASSDEQQSLQQQQKQHQQTQPTLGWQQTRTGNQINKVRSPYCRERFSQYRFTRKCIYFKILGYQKIVEINFDTIINAELFYLDKNHTISVICEISKIGNQSVLTVRSPYHISNLLNFPFNMQFSASNRMLMMRDSIQFHPAPFEQSLTLRVNPETNTIIPVNAVVDFDLIKICPLDPVKMKPIADWNDEFLSMPLFQSERDLFAQEPLYIRCQRQNSGPLIFILSSNVLNLNQADQQSFSEKKAVSLKYLTIQPPLMLENTLPFPININLLNQDKSIRPMSLNLQQMSERWFLQIDPRLKIQASVGVKDYIQSSSILVNFDQITKRKVKVNKKVLNRNRLDSNIDSVKGDQFYQSQQNNFEANEQKLNKHRFLQTSNAMFQITSPIKEAIIISVKIGKIQGFYKMKLFQQFWFLNQSEMQVSINVLQNYFKFPTVQLPYESRDFNFDLIKQIEKEQELRNEKQKKGKKQDALQFDQGELKKDLLFKQAIKKSEESIVNIEEIDVMQQAKRFRELQSYLSESNKGINFRRKPWELYKFKKFSNGITSILQESQPELNQQIYLAPPDDQIQDPVQIPISIQHNMVKTKFKVSMLEEDKQERVNFLTQDQLRKLDHSNQKQLKTSNLPALQKFSQNPLIEPSSVSRIRCFSSSFYQSTGHFEDEDRISQLLQRNLSFSLKVGLSEQRVLNADKDLKCGADQIEFRDNIKSQHPCLYQLIINTQFLPYPFHHTKLVTLKPKYIIQNKLHLPLNISQFGAQAHGSFKVFPLEQTIFHWCDAKLPKLITLAADGYEFSGAFKIEGIKEFFMRLKSIQSRELLILKVSINEQSSSYTIRITNSTHKPPIRIQNLTKYILKLSQVNSKPYQFDSIHPYQIISYAWAFPQKEKKLKAQMRVQERDINLGTYSLQHKQSNSQYNKDKVIEHKKFPRDILVHIINDPNMKIFRATYSCQKNFVQQTVTKTSNASQNFKLCLRIDKIGISILNSSMKQICFLSLLGIDVINELAAQSHKKFVLKLHDVQLDNQLSHGADDEAVIISKANYQGRKVVASQHNKIQNSKQRKPREKQQNKATNSSQQKLLSVSFKTEERENIDNFISFSYFHFTLNPIDLRIDGLLIEELYNYGKSIHKTVSFINLQDQYASTLKRITSIKKMEFGKQKKKRFNQLEIENSQSSSRDKIINFHKLTISPIQINLSYSYDSFLLSNQEMFNKATLRFALAIISNLKNMSINLTSFQRQNHQTSLSTFLSQLRHEYQQKCLSKRHFFRMITSMGIFTQTFGNFSLAVQDSFGKMLESRNKFIGACIGVKSFFHNISYSVLNTGSNFFSSLHSGIHQFSTESQLSKEDQEINLLNSKMNLKSQSNEDNLIEQARQQLITLCTASQSLQQSIDSQNRVWLKMILIEKQSFQRNRAYQMNERYQEIGMSSLPRLLTGYSNNNNNNSNNNNNRLQGNPTPQPNSPQQQLKFKSQIELPNQATPINNRTGAVGNQQEEKKQIVLMQNQQQRWNYNYMKKIFLRASLFIPKYTAKLLQIIFTQARNVIGNDHQNYDLKQRIRPPRFIGYNRELEIYSFKKSLAFNILQKINLSVSQSENIQSFYSLNRNAVIITARRIICVSDQDLDVGVLVGEKKSYNSWDIDIKDILLTQLELIHPNEGINVVYEAWRVINDAKLMKELIQNNTPIKLSLFYFGKSDAQDKQQKPFPNNFARQSALFSVSDLRVESNVIECTIHQIKTMKKIHAEISRKLEEFDHS